NIAWFMADQYIQKLNKSGSAKLRLPSEAEWEYACRAGGKHKTYCGDGQVKQLAWHKTNSNKQPHSVGKLQPNAFGLYDMSGNVWEWVEDTYHANYQGAPADGSAWTQQNMNGERVLRGGAYADNAEDALATFRTKAKFTIRYPTFGFRIAMTPQ
ncbi:MAG: formylglycine-generating enzyme family protein, partial [Gammaproteobacteria bacterium]|nr:formylglycine-generating enzyme family protein [Gammaproteobacteria bacterium]